MLTFAQVSSDCSADMELIFKKRPLFKSLLENFGHKTLAEWSAETIQIAGSAVHARHAEFIDTYSNIVRTRLGEELAQKATSQLRKHYCTLTTDHHAPMNANLGLSANSLFAVGSEASGGSETPFIVGLSCGNVSQNNKDYPRGILMHDLDGKIIQIPFLPSSSRNSAVYGFRSYTALESKKALSLLSEIMNAGRIPPEEGRKLKNVIESVFCDKDVLLSQSLSDQYMKVNMDLWPKLFNQNPAARMLLLVEMEEVVSMLISTHHITSDTLIHQALFDGKFRDGFFGSLTQSMELFLRQGVLGTYLFWGLSRDKNYRIPLTCNAGVLRSADGTFSLPMTSDSIHAALLDRRITPNLLLVFTVLHLYYGLGCIGGFNQLHYLDAMRKTYAQAGFDSDIAFSDAQLYGYDFNLFFLEPQSGARTPAFALDLLLYGGSDVWKDFTEACSTLTLREVFQANSHVISSILLKASATPL